MSTPKRALVFLFLMSLQFNAVAALCLDHFSGEKVRVYHSMLSKPHASLHSHHEAGDPNNSQHHASDHDCHLSAASALSAGAGDSLMTPLKEGASSMPLSLALPQTAGPSQEEPAVLLKQLSYAPPDRPPRR